MRSGVSSGRAVRAGARVCALFSWHEAQCCRYKVAPSCASTIIDGLSVHIRTKTNLIAIDASGFAAILHWLVRERSDFPRLNQPLSFPFHQGVVVPANRADG